MRLGRLDGFEQGLHPLLDGRDDLFSVRAIIPERVLSQRAREALQHAVVVDDQAEVLARIHPVRARYGLHQRVRLHRLVDVERRQTFHVEAGQPHRADDCDAERVLGVLEGRLDIDPLAIRVSKPCFIRARCGMMSNPHFLKSATSFCASLMMISTMVSSSHVACAASSCALRRKRRVQGSSAAASASACLASAAARTSAAFACHRGTIIWYIRAQVILSMHTNRDFPDSHRVAQCSTKSSAILSSRSSAVMTS